MKWLKVRLSKPKEWIAEKWKVALIVVGVVLVPLIVWKLPEWQVRAYHGRLDAGAMSKLDPKDLIQLQKDLITAENNARVTIAQIIGGLVVLLGLYATFKNVKVAEEGKLTERFSKAVELLGNKELDIRLGGIYALERIARDSQKDHWTVMEVLTAFVREQTSDRHEKATRQEYYEEESGDYVYDPDEFVPVEKVRGDIQAALTVIARRKWVEQEGTHQRIDLSNSFLSRTILKDAKLERAILNGVFLDNAVLDGARLNGADLMAACIRDARLNGSHLNNACLTGAKLDNAQLNNARLNGAKLNGAHLNGARLCKASLEGADLRVVYFRSAFLEEANFTGADLNQANLWRTDLTKVRGLTWEQIIFAIKNETTKLPPELEERRKAEQGEKAAAPNQ